MDEPGVEFDLPDGSVTCWCAAAARCSRLLGDPAFDPQDGTTLPKVDAELVGCWWLDVAARFDDAEQLHHKLAGGSGVAYVHVKDTLTSLLADHGGSVELRHCRLVWQVALGPR